MAPSQGCPSAWLRIVGQESAENELQIEEDPFWFAEVPAGFAVELRNRNPIRRARFLDWQLQVWRQS